MYRGRITLVISLVVLLFSLQGCKRGNNSAYFDDENPSLPINNNNNSNVPDSNQGNLGQVTSPVDTMITTNQACLNSMRPVLSMVDICLPELQDNDDIVSASCINNMTQLYTASCSTLNTQFQTTFQSCQNDLNQYSSGLSGACRTALNVFTQ